MLSQDDCWSFFKTMTYTKDNFCFHESIFHRQIKLISYRSEFWRLRRKPAFLFSKQPFFQNSLIIPWATYSGKMQVKKQYIFWTFYKIENGKVNCDLFCRSVFSSYYSVSKFPLNLLILGQKACFLGPTIFEVPQPNWY